VEIHRNPAFVQPAWRPSKYWTAPIDGPALNVGVDNPQSRVFSQCRQAVRVIAKTIIWIAMDVAGAWGNQKREPAGSEHARYLFNDPPRIPGML
jgi:hypothetical protein